MPLSNSRPGSSAISQGADLIEIDLHLSADGQLVVIHDDTVDRTSDGTGRVGDLSIDELRALDTGSWMSPKFGGEKIPTFSEVLDCLPTERASSLNLSTVPIGTGASSDYLSAQLNRQIVWPMSS